MLASFLLSLREGLEAALIIGILFGALRKFHRGELGHVVWGGTLSAVLISLATALILNSFGASLEGRVEQIFEGTTMLLAAGLLTWMIFWMSNRARYLKRDLEANVQQATLKRGARALFLLAFLAVLREGIELVLFLTATALTSSAQQTLIGSLLGLSTASLLGWALFASTLRLDLHRFFQVTGFLLILFAAGLVAQGAHEFIEAGLVPAIIEHVWDINFILNEKSIPGEMLKALFGYNGNPSLTEILAYGAYFVVLVSKLRQQTLRPAMERIS